MNALIRIAEHLVAGAKAAPRRLAFADASRRIDRARLSADVAHVATLLVDAGIAPGDRVATYAPKSYEAVVGMLAVNLAGAMLVPIHPQLKEGQIRHILADSAARLVLTTQARMRRFTSLQSRRDLIYWLTEHLLPPVPLLGVEPPRPVPVVDSDPAAILYTSGSSGPPKGVVLSQRNLVAGAQSVAAYQRLEPDDVILGLLPLSFDAGLSQLTSALVAGACYAPLDFLTADEVPDHCARVRATSITGVPPLWMQLADADWPPAVAGQIRRIASTGGHMPRALLERLRTTFVRAEPYLMYGLTEAFRSTWLSPQDASERPDSIGKAVPNAEVLVLRPDGSVCADDEPGELVHRGAFVTLGYWNAPELTAQRYRPAPRRHGEIPLGDTAVWSGDIVRRDGDGFLYFIARSDDLIKTSGYRVSPTEIEDVLFTDAAVVEAAVIGVPHPQLGQAIVACVRVRGDSAQKARDLARLCHEALPTYMVPRHIAVGVEALPRGPTGKIDRAHLKNSHALHFEPAPPQGPGPVRPC
ncbi:MAG: acyl-CoA ligase (AMP-forming), exosortase A system-associated [Pseudomonadota bacterium]|nr:acyl-CoA ligase (AMP-forming), exosortase A system-associated [Pseudomonadota bacterium]